MLRPYPVIRCLWPLVVYVAWISSPPALARENVVRVFLGYTYQARKLAFFAYPLFHPKCLVRNREAISTCINLVPLLRLCFYGVIPFLLFRNGGKPP